MKLLHRQISLTINSYPRTENPTLSLIVPAYNEGQRIEKVLASVAGFFPDAEILVVCNGCVDNTLDIVSGLSKQFSQIKLAVFPEKLGKGGAIIEGFKIATGNIIGFLDADESTAPEDMCRLINAMGDKDGIIASRRLKDSRILVKQPLLRRATSKAFNILVQLMFGLAYKDTQCGAKAFRKTAIRDILSKLTTKGFEFDVELLWRLKLEGYQVDEFPITWRHSKGSTFSLKNAPGMFISLLKLRLKGNHPVASKGPGH
jgi:glycosyltransferase involved in cell wall biosynthesis